MEDAKQIQFRIPVALLKKARTAAKKMSISLSAWIRVAIIEKLNRS
jgi:predicted HicB family RNase H-like nuclease